MTTPRNTVTVMLDPSGVARSMRVPTATLRVLHGPDRGRSLRKSAARLLVGTSERADLPLSDPTVSALHCELLADETGLRLRDLESKNGVFLGERRVCEIWLGEQDTVVLGETTLHIDTRQEPEEQPLSAQTSFGRLRGSSLRMRRLYGELARAAACDAHVLIQGETGTGKELAAEAIAEASARRDGPFVVVDCGSLPVDLAESELFGHEAGAFTGAERRKPGAFERAHGGTVFLDEIGELPLVLQTRLLRVLQEKTVQPLGARAPLDVDVRVIAATHRELEREVNRGAFRADLYFRLAVLTFKMPALREHREDLPELVAALLEELGGVLPPAKVRALYEGEYPGNVRELRNAIECRLHGLTPPRPLQAPVQQGIDLRVPFHHQKGAVIEEFERRYLEALLVACRRNVSEASRRSGLSRQHLYGLLRRHRADGEP